MIVRQLSLRHGRKALARPATRSWRRALASVVDQHTSHFDHVDPISIGLVQRQSEPVVSAEDLQNQAASKDPKLARYARNYWEMQDYKTQIRHLGAKVSNQYKPHLLVNHPPSPHDITLELLMASQAHLGHATGLWHPGNARYIYGVRDGIHIISLDVTASHLRRACKIVQATSRQGGLILFVGTRSGQDRSVVKAAELAGGCHLFDRWIPGSITNRIQILGNCRTKVVNKDDKDVSGYEKQLMNRGPVKPDLVVCLNPLENHVLLRECNQHHIPTIGVVDTDCNPALVTYPIPANDDSRRCTNVIAGALGRAAEIGRTERLAYASVAGRSTHRRRHNLEEAEREGASGDVLATDPELEVRQAEAQEDLNETEEHESEPEKSHVLKKQSQQRLDPMEGHESTDPQAEFLESAQAEKWEAAFEMFNFSDYEYNGMDLLLPTKQELASSEQPTQEAISVADGETVGINKTPKVTHATEHMSADAAGQQPRATEIEIDQAADPMLSRLIAMKRRALGEELSAEDRQLLQEVEQSEAAVRTEVEKGRQELREEVAVASQQLQEMIQSQAVDADKETKGELQARDQDKARAQREDFAAIGPVTKNRKGRPDERQ